MEFVVISKGRSAKPNLDGLTREEKIEQLMAYHADLGRQICEKFPGVTVAQNMLFAVMLDVPSGEMAAQIAEEFNCWVTRADTTVFYV